LTTSTDQTISTDKTQAKFSQHRHDFYGNDLCNLTKCKRTLRTNNDQINFIHRQRQTKNNNKFDKQKRVTKCKYKIGREVKT